MTASLKLSLVNGTAKKAPIPIYLTNNNVSTSWRYINKSTLAKWASFGIGNRHYGAINIVDVVERQRQTLWHNAHQKKRHNFIKKRPITKIFFPNPNYFFYRNQTTDSYILNPFCSRDIIAKVMKKGIRDPTRGHVIASRLSAANIAHIWKKLIIKTIQ